MSITTPINSFDSLSSYGNPVFEFDDDIKNEEAPISDCTFKARCYSGISSLCGMVIAAGVAVNEQLKNDDLRHRSIYILSCIAVGSMANIFSHSTLYERFRRNAFFYISAFLVAVIFFERLIYSNKLHSSREMEIMLGAVFGTEYGFCLTGNLLNKFSLNLTDYIQAKEHTEDPSKLYPMLLPSTRDILWTGIMLSVFTLFCSVVGGLYGAYHDEFTDDLNDIGVYSNALFIFAGIIVGYASALFGSTAAEKLEKYYKDVKEPSMFLKGALITSRTLNRSLSLFSSTIIGILLQIVKSLHASLHTKREIRQAANSGLSCSLMLIIGAIYAAQLFVKGREKEDPLSPCHEIRRVNQKEWKGIDCRANWLKACKKVFDAVFPYFLILGMMVTFCTIIGMTGHEVIRGTVGGMIAAFILMTITNYFIDNQPFEGLDGTESSLTEWKIKFANSLRFTIQTPEVLAPIFMYFTNKFNLDNIHLKLASPAIRNCIIFGLILYPIVFVQYQMQYRTKALAPLEFAYLILIQLSNIVATGFTPQGNHT